MPTSRTALEIVRANVLTRFNAILGALFVVILMTGPWQDALFGGVFVLNTLIGIIQELRAKRTLDRLALVSQPRARALRSGRSIEIATAEVVLDDILELAPGDQVVVDSVMLDATGLEIDESLLTGESAAVPKRPGDEVLSGSFVVAGSGRCRVTRVGASGYGHLLASEAKHFSLAHSEMRVGINQILRYITWAIVPTAALLFAGHLAIQAPMADALLYSAAAVVAMVPEGLVLLAGLAWVMLATVIVAGGIHFLLSHDLDQLRCAPTNAATIHDSRLAIPANPHGSCCRRIRNKRLGANGRLILPA